MDPITSLKNDIRTCTFCAPHLILPPRPVIQFSATSRILIAAQAPGKAVHNSGIPFDDPSGKRLREWLGVSKETFYNDKQFAILPMGFCYPGTGTSGDLAPRPECAKRWREKVLTSLHNIQLTIIIGQYAIAYHLPGQKKNLTERVRHWREYWPTMIPMPHPSPRNNIWLKKNPWFERDVLPTLRRQVAEILSEETS